MNRRIFIFVLSLLTDIVAIVFLVAYYESGKGGHFLLIPHNALPYVCVFCLLTGMGLMVPLYFAEKAHQRADNEPAAGPDEAKHKKSWRYFYGILLTLVIFGGIILSDLLENTTPLIFAAAAILAVLALRLGYTIKASENDKKAKREGRANETGPA